MGPLIKTQMTRCIHCTRCVRFATEVAGVPEIGAIGRGENMEITTYLEKSMESELSANVIDLCPVGALTSKPYAFEARPWELKKTESVDVMDAVGSNIRVDTYNWEVKRILPRLNNEINEEWISDKTRYSCDGLLKQRLDVPYIKKNNKLQKSTWDEAINLLVDKIQSIQPNEIAGHIGDMINMENAVRSALKNKSVKKSKIKSKKTSGKYEIIGDSTEDIKKIVNKEHDFSQKLLSAKKPIIIIGESALELKSGGYIFEEFKRFLIKNNLINENWNGLNILVQNASTVGLLDLKILQDKKEKSSSFFDDLKNRKFKLLYLLGSDNLEFQKNDEFIVYQGSHGDRGAEIADLILPSATYTEQNGLYENLEGRIQECKKASYPIGEALEDWKIFNQIIKKLGSKDYKVKFDELRKEGLETAPNFSGINELPKKSVIKTNNIETSFFSEKIFVRELDYYYTNSISRSSKTMSECRQIRQKIKKDGTNN